MTIEKERRPPSPRTPPFPAGIDVVAIHSHMTEEEPRVLFLHYWGIGPAAQLARGLKSALDAQAGTEKARR